MQQRKNGQSKSQLSDATAMHFKNMDGHVYRRGIGEGAADALVGGLKRHLILLLLLCLQPHRARAAGATAQHAAVLPPKGLPEGERVIFTLLRELRARAGSERRSGVGVGLARPRLPHARHAVRALVGHRRCRAVELARPAAVVDEGMWIEPAVPVALQHGGVLNRPAGLDGAVRPRGLALRDVSVGAGHAWHCDGPHWLALCLRRAHEGRRGGGSSDDEPHTGGRAAAWTPDGSAAARQSGGAAGSAAWALTGRLAGPGRCRRSRADFRAFQFRS